MKKLKAVILKRNTLYLTYVAIILVIGVILFDAFKRGVMPTPSVIHKRSQTQYGKRQVMRLRELVESPVREPMATEAQRPAQPPAPEPIETTQETPPPSELTPKEQMRQTCQSEWQVLEQTGLTELEEDLLQKRSLLSQECAAMMIEAAEVGVVRRFALECVGEPLLTAITEEIQANCVPLVPQVRAYSVYQLYPEPLADPLERDPNLLVNKLVGSSLASDQLTESQVDENIRIADALISEMPDLYAAYKAKLINLVISEAKFGRDIDVSEYEDLYDELLEFTYDPTPETVSELGAAEEELLSQQIEEEALSQPPTGAEDSVTEDNLTAEPGATESTAEEQIAAATAQTIEGVDEDLLHIPFIRLSAKGEYQELADMAEEYIVDFPDSYLGYLYLADSYWKQGERDAALAVLQQAMFRGQSNKMLIETYRRATTGDPLDQLVDMQLGLRFDF